MQIKNINGHPLYTYIHTHSAEDQFTIQGDAEAAKHSFLGEKYFSVLPLERNIWPPGPMLRQDPILVQQRPWAPLHWCIVKMPVHP